MPDVLTILRTVEHQVRFQVLTAVSMKMNVFWVVAPCSLVEVYRRFRGACCLHHQGDRPGGWALLPRSYIWQRCILSQASNAVAEIV
jgi:hypothetical protein